MRGLGAGGVRWRNTDEGNSWTNTRTGGRADEGDVVQMWRETPRKPRKHTEL